jgi:hypothetical protein
MAPHAGHQSQQELDAPAREEERDGEAGGVDGEQIDAAGNGVVGAGDGQDRAEDWSDVRGPPECECRPHGEGADESGGIVA